MAAKNPLAPLALLPLLLLLLRPLAAAAEKEEEEHEALQKQLSCPENMVPWPEAGKTLCQDFDLAVEDATAFLKANLPPYDRDNEVTLFGEPGGVDGLNTGIAAVAVNMSLEARMALPWAARVPRGVFNDYVLPYASLNEARTNARPLLRGALLPLLRNAGARTIDDVVYVVNGYNASAANGSLWTAVSREKIYFKSGQTPLVYDPMSAIAFGYASCTGISVLYVDALRAVGVAARVVGTPAWHNVTANGNHNWVEVWRGPERGWSFIEGRPAGQGESLDDPCDKWFCNPAHFPDPNDTPVFAARFDRGTGVVYPMAWDPKNDAVPGVDRTNYYASTCLRC